LGEKTMVKTVFTATSVYNPAVETMVVITTGHSQSSGEKKFHHRLFTHYTTHLQNGIWCLTTIILLV